MNSEIKKDGSDLYINIEGRLDTNTAPEFESQVGTIPEDVKNIYINLSNLNYIASSGLRVLLKILKSVKANSGTVTLQNPNEAIFEILDTTGFTDIFEIES